MLRDAALRAAPQHEGTSELQFGMRSAVLVLRSARAVEAPQIGAGGYKPLPQDATPRSAFRIVSGDAPR